MLIIDSSSFFTSASRYTLFDNYCKFDAIIYRQKSALKYFVNYQLLLTIFALALLYLVFILYIIMAAFAKEPGPAYYW